MGDNQSVKMALIIAAIVVVLGTGAMFLVRQNSGPATTLTPAAATENPSGNSPHDK
jgi:hypothetical protein